MNSASVRSDSKIKPIVQAKVKWWISELPNTHWAQLTALKSEDATVSAHEGNSPIAVGQGCNGREWTWGLDSSRLICFNQVQVHIANFNSLSILIQGRNWQEHCDPHARAQVSISAMPAATHLHVSVTIYWAALNITCVAEDPVRTWAFTLSIIQEEREWHTITCR